jgi:predicted membrane channel-forming protein YqfA (hemolysin III family)
MKLKKETQRKLTILSKAASFMFTGLFLFKFIPMEIFGKDIKFDASAHITITMFCLYVIWFYIDQNKAWRNTFFIFALVVISIVSIQRILMNAHNDIGLLGGLLLSIGAIIYSQPKYFKDKFRF